jgi:signal peptidase II
MAGMDDALQEPADGGVDGGFDDDMDDEIVDDADGDDAAGAARAGTAAWRGPSAGRWALFAGIAIVVVVVDQLAKTWITANLDPGESMTVLGDWLRFVHGQNSGILFGLLPQSAPIFAVVSLAVTGLIVYYHRRTGRGILVTVALGLLLGGAIGNLLDRLNHGYVVDFVDMGIGTWRFFTYNLADASITTAILLLLAMAVFPKLADLGADA